MFDAQFVNSVVAEAEMLNQNYSKRALLDLLQVEQKRIMRQGNLTLGLSSKDLAEGAFRAFMNFVADNPVVSKMLLMDYLVNRVVAYLVLEGLISQTNAQREQFVIALVVALIFDRVLRWWREHQQ